MTITLACNGGQHVFMFTPRLSIVLSLFGVLALGLFTLVALLLGSIIGVLYVLWVSVAAISSVSFVLPALSFIVLCFIVVLLLLMISKQVLAVSKEYHARSAGKAQGA